MISDIEYLSVMREAVFMDVKQSQAGRTYTQASGGSLGHNKGIVPHV